MLINNCTPLSTAFAFGGQYSMYEEVLAQSPGREHQYIHLNSDKQEKSTENSVELLWRVCGHQLVFL